MPSKIKPYPLYPNFSALKDFINADYPGIDNTILKSKKWMRKQWFWGKSFLEFVGRNKSEHTYIRFRSDIERFILWSVLIKNSPVAKLKKKDILAYADFCWQPPVSWIGYTNQQRFKFTHGFFESNSDWRPYKICPPKNQSSTALDKKKYRPSQQTLTSTFTAIIVFYHYLMSEERCLGNPAQLAKKDCRHFVTQSQIKEVKRLTGLQWQYVLETAIEMADSNAIFERNLFVITALKTLFLRISELSERDNWIPVMGHIWQDDDENWWLKVFGKGRKIRDITVPLDFMPFLKRYRLSRKLTGLPASGESFVLVEKIRGRGGMSARHLRRLVQQIFDQAYLKMKQVEGRDKAVRLREASSHWLRHTGASMEIERGRALKDLSEDLGHASMSTTDAVYVQTENKKRAESGKKRKVD